MTIPVKYLVVVAALVCVLIAGNYFALKGYFDQKEALGVQAQLNAQNNAAFEQQLHQKADSVQVLCVQVKDLNGALTKSQKEQGFWKAVSQHLTLLLDSLRDQGSGIVTTGSDSLGDFTVVTFDGAVNIVRYAGSTTYYIRTGKASYTIDISLDPINIRNTVYRDVDKLWKIKTESLTPGVKLLAEQQLDSALFVLTDQRTSSSTEPAFPDFGLRVKGNLGIASNDIKGTQFNGVFLDASAEAYYKHWNITYYPFSKIVSAGIVYNFNVGALLSKIF